MNIKPLHDRIIVKRIEEDEMTSGGLVIPDSAKETPAEGEIISAGPGATDDKGNLKPMGVKVGDRVIFQKYSGTEVKIEGELYFFMTEDDVLGIVER